MALPAGWEKTRYSQREPQNFEKPKQNKRDTTSDLNTNSYRLVREKNYNEFWNAVMFVFVGKLPEY